MNTTKKMSWKKSIALFLISQNVSLFGSSVVSFAVLWHITLVTSSGKWLMLATICSILPQVIISLWGGVWADRHNRKYLIMLSDGFIAIFTLGLAIAFYLGFTRIELLLAVSIVRSIGAGIQTPAVNALYPQIVPIDKLTKVQGVNQTLSSILQLVAPAVGGVVLGSLGVAASFLIDVFTAALAIIILSFIHVEKVKKEDSGSSMFSELKSGVAYVFKNTVIRRIVVFFGISFILITPVAVLSPLYIERAFSSDVFMLTINEVVWTAGSLIGGVYVYKKQVFKNKPLVVAVCLFFFGVTFGLLGVATNLTMFFVIMGISGFFMPIIITAQTVLIQENVEQEIMGRVFSIVQIMTASAIPIAILFFGPLADVVPLPLIFIVTGALLAAVGVLYHVVSRRGRPA